MSLVIRSPSTCKDERLYAYTVTFERFLGIPFRVEWMNDAAPAEVEVTVEGSESKIRFSDQGFVAFSQNWLQPSSLPNTANDVIWTLPVDLKLAVPVAPIPVLYKDSNRSLPNLFRRLEGETDVAVDVFATIFFCLSRYEEGIEGSRDGHDRFAASRSIASTRNFLLRPLVDEYVEILWSILSSRWPALRRKARSPRIVPSCDVDRPLSFLPGGRLRLAKTLTLDLVKRRSPQTAVKRLANSIRGWQGDLATDPNNSFDFIMAESERHGLKSTFFFIATLSQAEIDGRYDVRHPWIVDLIRRICDRGHRVGLHPSYQSFRSSSVVAQELSLLREALALAGHPTHAIGARQHYLRWENPTTWQIYEQAGLAYDATMTFADHVGFRAGTCHSYTAYDLGHRKPLNLTEEPLVVMDGSFDYMGYNPESEQAMSMILRLADHCRSFGGDFSFLWHNTSLTTPSSRLAYQKMMAALTR